MSDSKTDASKLNIVEKQIKSHGSLATRYFVHDIPGFDGTANGYGYKSKQTLHKAYWYHLNRDRLKSLKKAADQFLKANKDVSKALDCYFDEDTQLDRLKMGEPSSIRTFVDWLQDTNQVEASEKMLANKHLWKYFFN